MALSQPRRVNPKPRLTNPTQLQRHPRTQYFGTRRYPAALAIYLDTCISHLKTDAQRHFSKSRALKRNEVRVLETPGGQPLTVI